MRELQKKNAKTDFRPNVRNCRSAHKNGVNVESRCSLESYASISFQRAIQSLFFSVVGRPMMGLSFRYFVARLGTDHFGIFRKMLSVPQRTKIIFLWETESIFRKIFPKKHFSPKRSSSLDGDQIARLSKQNALKNNHFQSTKWIF